MKSSKAQHFLIDDWIVAPTESLILRRDTRIHLEPKTMDVLCHLSEHSHRVVSSEQLLTQCWPETCLGDSVVYKNIAVLRKALGEKKLGSQYIQTIPKRGYRLHAQVVPMRSTSIEKSVAEQQHLEQILRILNRLTQKQVEQSEITLSDLNKFKKDNGLLLKISKRLLEYVTGMPRYDDFT
ncbi:MAG: winged helix-turn-helix domain-containing protein [Arenimonas sp.]